MRGSKSDETSIYPEVIDLDASIRLRVQEALDDPRPVIPADEVFAKLRAHHAERLKSASREA